MLSDLLLVLTDPVIRRNDLNQFHQVCIASVARHARHSGGPPEAARVRSPAPASPRGIHGMNKRTLSQAFTGVDLISALPESQRQCVRSPLFTTGTSMLEGLSAHNLSCGLSMATAPDLVAAKPIVSFGHRMPIIPEPVQDNNLHQALKNAVDGIDQSSLMPTSLKPGDDGSGGGVWYTLCLRLRPSEASHPSYRYRVHRKELHLAVDTADSSFWLYQEGFQELFEEDSDPDTVGGPRPWSETDARKIAKRRCLPRPDEAPIGDCVRMTYMDGGIVELARWPAECDLTFSVPSWDWQNNQKAKVTELQFPQILAQAASKKSARQPVDGNVGFTVPGYRHPWKNTEETDRVTFFDILHQAECVEAVEDIADGELIDMQLTVRLLSASGCNGDKPTMNDRARSFLYFGRGTPCGLVLEDGTLALPEFSPAMRIFPDRRDPTVFRMWTLELKSLSLLEPLVDKPDHDSLDENQWERRRISASSSKPRVIDLFEDFPVDEEIGIPVAFDSCAGCSVLPRRIVEAIWSEWFEQDPEEMPENGEAIWYHGTEDRFSDHDLLFEFIDGGGATFPIRCNAGQFLSSPWCLDSGRQVTCVMALEDPAKPHDLTWTLGMNFFWAFMVKFEATYAGSRPVPGTHNPTVRFAPQRVVTDGAHGDARDLKILPDLPPRLQNELRGCHIPELHPGDLD